MRQKLLKLLVGDLASLVQDPLAEFSRRSVEAAIVRLRIGRETCHLISNPAAIKHILLTNAALYDKDTASFRAIRLLLGNGLLTSSGDLWVKQRRLISPAFKAENMRYFLPILARHAALSAERWRQCAYFGQLVNATAEFNTITLMAVAESLFSDDLHEFSDLISVEFPIILECLANRVASPIQLPLWLPTPNNRRLVLSLRRLRRVVGQLIARRRHKLQGTEPGSLDNADLLTQMICRRDSVTDQPMDDRQINDEVMTLLIAGHETTANALIWLFLLLHDHPSDQRRLRDEIDSTLSKSASFSIDNLRSMHWCRAVIQETLRLYPPVWLFSRRALSDDIIDDYRINKGDVALFCPYALHRIDQFWDRPGVFNPERFISSQASEPTNFTYLPFGGGKRSCLGAGFAMIEAQIILNTLIRSFEYSVVNREQILPRPMITLRTSQPLMLKLHPIDPAA